MRGRRLGGENKKKKFPGVGFMGLKKKIWGGVVGLEFGIYCMAYMYLHSFREGKKWFFFRFFRKKKKIEIEKRRKLETRSFSGFVLFCFLIIWIFFFIAGSVALDYIFGACKSHR